MGGVQRLIADDIHEMVLRGIDVWLVTFEKEGGASLMNECALPSERTVYIPYPRLRNIRGFFATVRCLYRIQPNMIMTHMWFANTVGRLAALLVPKAAVLSFEHTLPRKRFPFQQRFFDTILQFVGTKVVAVSISVRDALIQSGIRSNRISVIKNGINLSRYREEKGIARAALGFSSDDLLFIFIGRLVKDKNVDTLLSALCQLQDGTLLIVGDGPERKTLEESEAARSLGSRVRFIGMSHEVPRFLAASDGVVLPSRREGFGLVLVEAAACGVPGIVSASASLTGVIADGYNGLVASGDEANDLAAVMGVFARDSHLRERLRNGAKESALPYAIERHVDELLFFYA